MPNSIRITIDASDLQQLPEKIKAKLAELQENRTLTKVIVKELLDSTDRAFASESDPNTKASWAEWTPAYARCIAMFGRPHKKLQDKGMRGGGLRSTIQTVAEKDYVSIGSNLRYARIHQLGGGSVRPGYHARPFLGMDERGKQKMERKLNFSYILGAKERLA